MTANDIDRIANGRKNINRVKAKKNMLLSDQNIAKIKAVPIF